MYLRITRLSNLLMSFRSTSCLSSAATCRVQSLKLKILKNRKFIDLQKCRTRSNLCIYFFQSIYYTILGWPEKDLNNELCVVTGGGGGLGRLLAMRLSRVGVKVILWDINQEGEWGFEIIFQVPFDIQARRCARRDLPSLCDLITRHVRNYSFRW